MKGMAFLWTWGPVAVILAAVGGTLFYFRNSIFGKLSAFRDSVDKGEVIIGKDEKGLPAAGGAATLILGKSIADAGVDYFESLADKVTGGKAAVWPPVDWKRGAEDTKKLYFAGGYLGTLSPALQLTVRNYWIRYHECRDIDYARATKEIPGEVGVYLNEMAGIYNFSRADRPAHFALRN